ncbi:MAG: hypothetical protein JXQ93_02185 [Flavobacteriaceae bacterium]
MKFVKVVNQLVYVVGFPVHAVATNGFANKGLDVLEEQSGFICYRCNMDSSEQEYLQWCNQLQERNRNSTALSEKQTMVLKKIYNFDVVNSTPVQCLAFVSVLKSMLKLVQCLLLYIINYTSPIWRLVKTINRLPLFYNKVIINSRKV